MNGTQSVRFSDLFADTVKTHGLAFAQAHYVQKHGMPQWEFRLWARFTLI